MVAVVVCNATQRLINTHDMTPIPPGVNTEISQEAFDHPDIQALVTEGALFRPEGSTDPQAQLAERREKEQERVREQEQFPPPLHTRTEDARGEAPRGSGPARDTGPGQPTRPAQQPAQQAPGPNR